MATRESYSMASITLRGGARMPAIGLGCWKIGKSACAGAVYEAIRAGYRALDCACDYGNEAQVGEGIKRAIDEGIVARKDLFVTSKIWMTYHAADKVEPALQRSLSDLQLEYLDLWLIHFPISLKFVPFETRYPPEWVHDPSAAAPRMVYDDVPLIETFRAMRALSGPAARVRHVGVCNMTTGLLADLSRACSRERIEPPEVLQVEMHASSRSEPQPSRPPARPSQSPLPRRLHRRTLSRRSCCASAARTRSRSRPSARSAPAATSSSRWPRRPTRRSSTRSLLASPRASAAA